jgi:hypothetical protein
MTGELEDRGYVVDKGPSEVVVEGRIGLLVMMILAHVLKEGTRATPVADNDDLAQGYVGVLTGHSGTLSTQKVLERDLDFLVPDLEDVDLEKWLRFRNRHASGLAEYRQSVEGVAFVTSRGRG